MQDEMIYLIRLDSRLPDCPGNDIRYGAYRKFIYCLPVHMYIRRYRFCLFHIRIHDRSAIAEECLAARTVRTLHKAFDPRIARFFFYHRRSGSISEQNAG